MNGNIWIAIGIVTGAISLFCLPYGFFVKSKATSSANSMDLAPGGKGGSATALKGGTAIGGAGGGGGITPGGSGGNAFAEGKDSFALGGEGGEGAQRDRPARGGRGPYDVLGLGDKVIPGVGRLGDFGRGGDGAFGNTPAQSGGPGLVIIEFLEPSTPDVKKKITPEKKTK